MIKDYNIIDNILFLDIEATMQGDIKELGAVYNNKILKTTSISKMETFLNEENVLFICGHNFLHFDMEILKETRLYQQLQTYSIIDTLPLSLLLFNEKTLHSLPKNYKSEDDFKNNPVEDSKITKNLLQKAQERFLSLDRSVQNIFYSLLKDQLLFRGFFSYISKGTTLKAYSYDKLEHKIREEYKDLLVDGKVLFSHIKTHPIELAYILALLNSKIEIKSHPPKVLYDYPKIVDIQKSLCFDFNKSDKNLSLFSKEVFGFGDFREFPKLNPTLFGKSTISQKEIIQASLRDESFVTVLPTGGGKTFTFWLPAIIKAKSYKSLTVVISPLQALIEDHIKSFNKNVANYKAVAISGFMSPLERSEAIEMTINGEADILYLAPESLRSNMIFNILKNRVIERFVIDEVHCLSTWGNDFRQDYYYICEYINDLIKEKPFQKHIPLSCFTATAKPDVIRDIKEYFYQGLDIKLDEYIAIPERKNLNYKSIDLEGKEKYTQLLKLVNEHDGSTLIYIPSSTKSCDEITQKLSLDTHKHVKAFHSKLDSQVKMEILRDYIRDDVDIIVATTAFGMGVDKPNITNVIHYEMSDSLENYAQEAGRGARDTSLSALCPILYDENDLDKHFASLNRSKLTTSDINSIFRVIKKNKGDTVYKSSFELAQEAGWDVEDDASDYKTKVKTALLELEREGYIERKRNRVRFYADSIAHNSIQKLHKYLENSSITKEDQDKLILVHQTIIGRGKTQVVQVDELAYLLGYTKHDISETILQLKEIGILGNSKDLTLELKRSALKTFKEIATIEQKLFILFSNSSENKVTIKMLNEEIGGEINHADMIKDIVRNWRDKSSFIFKRINRQNDLWYFEILDKKLLKDTIVKKQQIAMQVLSIFISQFEKNQKIKKIEFSLKDIREEMNKEFTIKEIDKTLLYLHYLKVIELLTGRFINYAPMQIVKTDKFVTKRKYTKEEYKKRLEKHYLNKIESIHIMGEYAKRLNHDNSSAIRFMKDYFSSPYDEFKKKYNLLKKKISRPITEHRYNKIFSQMSQDQQMIIKDKQSRAMMILAGPGSGKTKVLIHKIASLILTEDIKPEQFMMLTFSRSAVREFQQRLNQLIGTLSYEIEINTFHAFALNLTARVISNENDDVLSQAICEATRQIKSGDIVLPLKTVLILDEFQDINDDSFALVKAIYEASDREIKIIAVGDDDQCINTHAGANINFIDKFKEEFGKDDDGESNFKQYELLTNFRSYNNIVKYSNDFILKVSKRYKSKALTAFSKKDGIVTVYSCKSKNIIAPTIKLVQQEDSYEDIAVLAYTNDEVMQIYSQLQDLNIPVRYIIDREKFSLKNIVEIVEFDKAVNRYLSMEIRYQEDDFYKAYEEIKNQFKGSKNIKLLKQVIDRFLFEHETYYASQWLAYLDELKLEDFDEYGKCVTVSTIHKSKGLEFNKVFLIINKTPKTDEEKRLYYVGMTRAKQELTILREGNNKFNHKAFANYIYDDKTYNLNESIKTFVMGLSDVHLGYDYQCYHDNLFLIAGEKIEMKKDRFDNLSLFYQNKKVGQFSKSFIKKLNYEKEEYRANIDYVVYWYDKEKQKYIQHCLCKIQILQ